MKALRTLLLCMLTCMLTASLFAQRYNGKVTIAPNPPPTGGGPGGPGGGGSPGSGGGPPSGAAGGVLGGSYPNPSFAPNVALPNGATATTQGAGDSSGKVATDLFVLQNGGGSPTGSAGGQLAGTYPNPTFAPLSAAQLTALFANISGCNVAGNFPNPAAGNCIAGGSSSSGIWSALQAPIANLSLNMAAYSSTFTYNAATGTADLFKLTDTASNSGTGIMAHFTTASGSSEIPFQADANGVGWRITAAGKLQSTDLVNNAAETFNPGSGGASTCPTPVAGSSFLCTDASNGISYSKSGTAYSPLQSGSTGVQINPSGNQIVNQNLGTSLRPTNLNEVYYVDGYTSANYPGIGVAQTVWSSGSYGFCSAVSYSGGNYLSVAVTTGVTPGTNSQVWYPVQDSNTPTAGDCAFYIAASTLTNTVYPKLILPPGETDTCIGWAAPTVPSNSHPGFATINIWGQGRSVSTLKLTCSLIAANVPALQQPQATTAFYLAGFDWEDFTVDANFNAPSVIGVYGAQQFVMQNIEASNPADGSDHYIEFGETGGANHTFGWVYEATLINLATNNNHGAGNGAVVTVTSTGTLTFVVNSGGSGYGIFGAGFTKLVLSGIGATADIPCSTRGTDTITTSGGAVTAITSTASGCAGTVYASVFGGNNVAYGIKFNDFSDSHMIEGLVPGGATGLYVAGISSMNNFYKTHPTANLIGITDIGNNNYYNTQCDTMYRYCMDIEGSDTITNLYATAFEWNNQLQVGSSDYHFGTTSNTPTNSPYLVNIMGDQCENQPTFNGYNHFLSPSGSIDQGTGMPTFVHVNETNYCNERIVSNIIPNYVGQQFSWGNGTWGSGYTMNLGSGTGSTVNWTGFLNGTGANQGKYNWQWTNPTPATSGQNYGSPILFHNGTYWDGSVSQSLGVIEELALNSGTGGAGTYKFLFNGTIPSNGALYSFDKPVTLGIFYSAAGTPLPTCNATLSGSRASVTDATSPTYLGTYTSGGAVHAPVFCNGTAWVTD